MIVTNRGTGLRPGDSRYPYKCDKCYRVVDKVQRKHTSVEQGKARAPGNLRPSKKWMVDGGDATVRSKWGELPLFSSLYMRENVIHHHLLPQRQQCPCVRFSTKIR